MSWKIYTLDLLPPHSHPHLASVFKHRSPTEMFFIDINSFCRTSKVMGWLVMDILGTYTYCLKVIYFGKGDKQFSLAKCLGNLYYILISYLGHLSNNPFAFWGTTLTSRTAPQFLKYFLSQSALTPNNMSSLYSMWLIDAPWKFKALLWFPRKRDGIS